MVIERDRRGRVEVVTINRPEALNALNKEAMEGLATALDEIESNASICAAVLTGAGEKAFSAGADLHEALRRRLDVEEMLGEFERVVRRRMAKPLIAAVNGMALGGGLEIMLLCDLAVACPNSMLGLPEVQRGGLAGGGGLIRLARRIPLAVALEIAMTGRPIEADRALRIGLINSVVPAERVVEEAVALAELVSSNAPEAVQLSKELVLRAGELSEEEAWRHSTDFLMRLKETADLHEGLMAFAEGRSPSWGGGETD